MRMLSLLCVLLVALNFSSVSGQDKSQVDLAKRERSAFKETFRDTVERIESQRSLKNIKRLEDWTDSVEQRRKQLAEMLGLDPMPLKTDLKAEVRGTVEAEDFIVEKILFQSQPGLYVTANFYRPKQQEKPLPAILYVCGHARAREGNRSYGNKTPYHHHAVWFVRHGYVALVIDTLQLGEIEGLHHGTYGIRKNGKYEKQWWWISRGYTPAGVEAWNGIRSVDYLISRKEVDPNKIGITGRSGGGAYSWYTAALDTRIQAAIPVAGITDLRNHVVDGVVAGHCDCMYMVNTYQWDYAELAALIAPRPLMIQNTDSDSIFPLDGVARIHDQLKHLYKLYKSEQNLRLFISPGPHKDTQPLQENAFAWFDLHLKESTDPITDRAEKIFEYKQLAVLEDSPENQMNTKIQASFVAQKFPPLPKTKDDWNRIHSDLKRFLDEQVFAGCPQDLDGEFFEKVIKEEKDGKFIYTVHFYSERSMPLTMIVEQNSKLPLEEVRNVNFVVHTNPLEGKPSPDYSHLPSDVKNKNLEVRIYPRGQYLTEEYVSERELTQIRRRYYLTGQTLTGMRVYDTRRAIRLFKKLFPILDNKKPAARTYFSSGLSDEEAIVMLFAKILEPENVNGFHFSIEKPTFDQQPELLNVLKRIDIEHAFGMLYIDLNLNKKGPSTFGGKGQDMYQKYSMDSMMSISGKLRDSKNPKSASRAQ